MARTLPSQPEVNIGLVGHVDHGKTTLTQALSGVWTDTHSEERRRGISIKLGYADTAFYKTSSEQYYATGRHPEGEKDVESELQRVVSFVDAPGHETLMAIMITGASIMDGAMLMVAANETCPQPQTREHLMALEIAGIKNIVVVQNKIDLVSRERAMESYNEIKTFLNGTIAKEAPIIPVSAHHDVNVDILIQAIEETIPTPNRDSDERAVMHIARSFDVNRPGTRPSKLMGGVIGGSIVEGTFREGDKVIIDLETVNRSQDLYGDDASEFNPNRELQNGVTPWGLSFGQGMHACIGQDLAAGLVFDTNSTEEDHLFGLVPVAVQTLFLNGCKPDPDNPPEMDDSTTRPYFGKYPVVFEK